jgi:hypothetical protein
MGRTIQKQITMAQPKKVDKRSKEYKDSLKRAGMADNVRASALAKGLIQPKTEKGKYIVGYDPINEPAKKSLSLTEQIQEQAQEIKNLWATVKVLQEQVTNIQTTVG